MCKKGEQSAYDSAGQRGNICLDSTLSLLIYHIDGKVSERHTQHSCQTVLTQEYKSAQSAGTHPIQKTGEQGGGIGF